MEKKISVIVPCYNEEESLPIFYEEINKVMNEMKKVKFELIFINDGSKDRTLEILRELAKKDKHVRYISFSRNFGKEAGILAGLEASVGDYVCMMDVDLQDPPHLLIEMYETLENSDYDCVATRSVSRNGYSFFRKLFTKWYYKIINKISKTEIVDGASDRIHPDSSYISMAVVRLSYTLPATFAQRHFPCIGPFLPTVHKESCLHSGMSARFCGLLSTFPTVPDPSDNTPRSIPACDSTIMT